MNGKAVIYTRKYKAIHRAEIDPNKWSGFYKCVQDAQKGGAEILMVHSPEVLGDNYEELVANLSAIASHKLHLVILPPEDAGYTVLKRLP
jgi:hypothetical protein